MSIDFRNYPWLKHVRYENFSMEKTQKLLNSGLEYDRPLNMPSVRKHLEAMRTEGAWWPYSPSQTPIIISKDGVRINGQHRLLAYAQYLRDGGEPFQFPVIRDFPMEGYDYIDIGAKSRSAKDAFYERENVTRDTARVNWLHALIIGDIFYTSSVATLKLKFDDTYADELVWASETFPSASKQMRAPFVVPFMYIYKVDKKFAMEMAEAWKTGDGLPPTLRTLRDHALVDSGQTKKSKKPLVGGGRAYTHEGLTFKILNVLAELHQKKTPSQRASNSSEGFKYWSDLRKDGAWSAYKNQKGAQDIKIDLNAALGLDDVG